MVLFASITHVTTAICLLILKIRCSLSYEVKAWQSLNAGRVNVPDYDIPSIASRPNTGISFSGGGSRSYIASLGYLSALHELNLIENIRYIVGVSGGSWATAVYSFYQNNSVSDTELLGTIVQPEDIKYEDLQVMGDKCARGFTNMDIYADMNSAVPAMVDASWKAVRNPGRSRSGDGNAASDSNSLTFELWSDAVQWVYLDPSGIPSGVPFSYDAATVEGIRTRNPELVNTTFLLLRQAGADIDARPLPIVGATLIGPLALEPFTPESRNYSILEYTPLSVGVAFSRNITYNTAAKFTADGETRSNIQGAAATGMQDSVIGGLIEPFAFNCAAAPTEGLEPEQSSGLLSVPTCTFAADVAAPLLDVNLAVSSSSFYSGCMVASIGEPGVAQALSGTVDYWAPSAVDPATDGAASYAIGDGGGLQISNMVSLLQRGVTNIVLFCSSSVPLQPSSHWDPAVDPLKDADIDFSIPIFFGQIPIDIPYSELLYYEVTQSQVFPAEDWVPLAEKLQAAQEAGSGIVVTSSHTTVDNQYYGIPAGMRVTVTWVYLGRASTWEAQLSDTMQKLVVPDEDPDNMAHTKESGPFESFPNYATLLSDINFERANLLADLAGWTIFENAEQFKQTLQ